MSIKNNIKRVAATLAIVGAITAGVFGASAVINGGADTASANGYQDWNGLMFFGQNSEGKQVGIGDATHYKVKEPNDDYSRIQIHIASPKGSTLYNDPPAKPERADYDSDADYQAAVWEYQKANNACMRGLIENRVSNGFTVDDDSSRPLVLNVFKDTMPMGCIGAVSAIAFDEDDNPVALFNPELTAAGTGPDGKHWTVAMPDGMIKEDADGNPVFNKSLTKTVTEVVRVRDSEMEALPADERNSAVYVDHVLDDDLGDFEARATQWFNAIPDACGGATESSDVPAATAAQIAAYVAKFGLTEEQAKQAHPNAFVSSCEARFDVEREVEIQVENPQDPAINSQDYELGLQLIVINNEG